VYAAWGGHANVVHYLLQAGAGNDAHEALRCIGGTSHRRSLGERGEVVRQMLYDYLAKQPSGAEEASIDRDANTGSDPPPEIEGNATEVLHSDPPPEIEGTATEVLRAELLKHSVGNDTTVRSGGTVIKVML
jgi:hypothetical protein